jgi:hypothetical protein
MIGHCIRCGYNLLANRCLSKRSKGLLRRSFSILRRSAMISTAFQPSNGVDEVWPLVTKLRNFLPALALDLIVPLTIQSLRILSSKQQMSHETSSDQEDNQIPQYYSMTGQISWLVGCTVDVRRHNTIQTSPPDHETHGYAAFVHTFGIVCGPDDGVCDAGIDTHGLQKGPGILYTRCAGRDKHDEANNS